MNDRQTNEIEKETFGSMLGDFYNRENSFFVAITWFFGLAFMAIAIYGAVMFFKAETTRSQILFAVIFLACFQVVGGIKVFAWQIIHRNRLLREIRKLKK